MYALLKIWCRVIFFLFEREITIVNPEALSLPGPLMLAVNHPNSFLDAMLLGTYMHNPVHFITRGDVFANPWVRKQLGRLHMIPIYRIRDGKEKLSLNEETAKRGVAVMNNGGILLIFVEGFCINQSQLQLPLKKGGPRMVVTSWQQHNPVKILPVWLSYQPMQHFKKRIELRFGQAFGSEIVSDLDSVRSFPEINAETERQLQALSSIARHTKPKSSIRQIALAVPALIGLILNGPYFLAVAGLVRLINGKNVHFDSFLLVANLIIYPFYLALIAVSLAFCLGAEIAISVLLFPVFLLAYTKY